MKIVGATTIHSDSIHVAMLSRPKEVTTTIIAAGRRIF